MKCGPSVLLYPWASCHFCQKLLAKTMDPIKPDTFMHLSRSITPIYVRGSPRHVFCAPSCYLKLSIKGQHPNNRFRCLLCAFNWANRLYIQADGVRMDQTSDHTRPTRRVRMRICLSYKYFLVVIFALRHYRGATLTRFNLGLNNMTTTCPTRFPPSTHLFLIIFIVIDAFTSRQFLD